MKQLIIILIIVLLCASVTLSWTPPGGEDIDLRYWSEIVNGTNISSINFWQDGNAVLDNTSTIDSNYSTYANYSDHANSSAYLDDYSSSDFILSSSESDLNVNSSVYSTNATRATEWDGETSQADLNVNDSDYLDGYDSTDFILSADEGNLNVNSSNSTSWWATLSGWSSTMFEAVANELSINLSWFNDSTDSRVATLEPDLNVNDSDYLDGHDSTYFIAASTESNLNVNHSNSTDYWGIYNIISDLNYGILSYWPNITGRPTYLSNFTNDLDLINSSYGNDTYILQLEEGNLNVNHSDTSGTATTWDGETSQSDLNVNSSNFWDNLNTPSDINAGDITNDGTYRLGSWDNFTGIPHATPSNGDVTHFSWADEIYDWVIGLGYITTDTNASTACSGGEVLYGNGSCGTPPDTTYSAGSGISLNGTNYFSVAGNTALTQDADGLSVTEGGITDVQLEYNMSPSSTPTFAEVDAPSNWTNNQNYPSYCPDYSAMSGVNDTIPCADWWLNINGGEDVTGLVNFTDKIKVSQTTTTGNTVLISRDLAAASTDSPVVQITNDNAGDDQPALKIQQDGGSAGLEIIKTLDVSTSGTFRVLDESGGSGTSYFIAGTGGDSNRQTGLFYRNLPSANTGESVVKIHQDNSGDDQPALKIQQDGSGASILALQMYDETVGGTNRDLFIDNTGKVGYVSSSLRYKENIEDMTQADWLYDLRPVFYDYKDNNSGIHQMGLIAEEVELINPNIVSYNYIEENDTKQVETVSYSKLIVPMLVELQNLKEENELMKFELCKPDNIFERVLIYFNITQKYAFCSEPAQSMQKIDYIEQPDFKYIPPKEEMMI